MSSCLSCLCIGCTNVFPLLCFPFLDFHSHWTTHCHLFGSWWCCFFDHCQHSLSRLSIQTRNWITCKPHHSQQSKYNMCIITKRTGQYYPWLWSKMAFVSLSLHLSISPLEELIFLDTSRLRPARSHRSQCCYSNLQLKSVLPVLSTNTWRWESVCKTESRPQHNEKNPNQHLFSWRERRSFCIVMGGTTGRGNITKIWNGTNEWIPARKPSQHLLYWKPEEAWTVLE